MEYVKGATASDAARRAGYSEKTARKAAVKILENPMVAKVVAEARAKFQEETEYDLKAAYKEVCEMINDAKQANQHAAAANLFQVKVKLFGLLTEKIQHQGEGFQLVIAGIDTPRSLEIVDAEFQPDPAEALPAPEPTDVFEE